MLRPNAVSTGEVPPGTRCTRGFSAATAGAAVFAISAKASNSWSSSKSQWDLLFGSFQIITASSIFSVLAIRFLLLRPCYPLPTEDGTSCGSSRVRPGATGRSEEHTSELQSLMRISYAVFCLKKKKHTEQH